MVSCQIGSVPANVQIKRMSIVVDTGVIPSIKQVQLRVQKACDMPFNSNPFHP